MKLSIIIPVYNEKNTVNKIIQQVQDVELEMEKEIILIDDGSTDGTREILKNLEYPNVKVKLQEKIPRAPHPTA